MTNPEVVSFLEKHQTVIIPVGAVEQHGPHSPLLTDVIIPTEIAKRIATRAGALVAPAVPYTLSYPHTGFVSQLVLVHWWRRRFLTRSRILTPDSSASRSCAFLPSWQ
ncbi:MAG: hypothetical protein DWH94_11660 [Planctomycetota bacterium]|nr:MAG: hypothetical protein DWH94_11660 [Planctomycetota bacterium]